MIQKIGLNCRFLVADFDKKGWQESVRAMAKACDECRIPTGLINIATDQSLINKKDNSIFPVVQEYGQVLIDECHHIFAPRFEMYDKPSSELIEGYSRPLVTVRS